MTPTCPTGYHCKFDPAKPVHYWAHWWDGPWGIVVAFAVVAALVAIICTIVVQWARIRGEKAERRAQTEERANRLAIEEQRTMQIDSAKGSPEMLKIVREMQQ